MPLTTAEFLAAVEQDQRLLRSNKAPSGVARCHDCGVPLQESITGNRQSGKEPVCSDCYFEKFGEELDRHPIGMLRVSRGT